MQKLFGYLFMFIVIELTVVGNNSAPSIENFTLLKHKLD